MKPEEQRIAIAKYCGWTSDRYHTLWTRPDKTGRYYLTDELPDYLNDINAMHEAENRLLDKLEFISTLTELRAAKWENNNSYDEWQILKATPSERAEAFLRTIGKWTE